MQSPSSAVKPSVLSTLFLPFIAQRLAPLPRCATITRPLAISGATSGSDRRDVLVGKSVEAVALDAGITNLLRQRHQFRHRRLAAMEAGIETRDLRHSRHLVAHGFDRRQVVRLMQRRQRHQRREDPRELPA